MLVLFTLVQNYESKERGRKKDESNERSRKKAAAILSILWKVTAVESHKGILQATKIVWGIV